MSPYRSRVLFLLGVVVLCHRCGKTSTPAIQKDQTELENRVVDQKESELVSVAFSLQPGFVWPEKQDFIALFSTSSAQSCVAKDGAQSACLVITRDGRVRSWLENLHDWKTPDCQAGLSKEQAEAFFACAVSDGILRLWTNSMTLEEIERSPGTSSIVAKINGHRIEVIDTQVSDPGTYAKVKNRILKLCSKALGNIEQ